MLGVRVPPPASELAVQIVGGADQRQVREGLGEVAELLARRPDLLRVQPDVVLVGEQPTRAARVATLSRVRAEYPLLEIDVATASCFARIADEQLSAGRRLRRQDAWIAATAMRHGAAIVTQHADFTDFASVEVIRV